MDNRRFSARADIGIAGARRSEPVRLTWLDRAIELTRLNWETIAFVGLMLVALFTRLWDLAPRAMHHDESIHAYFSNWFLKSGDYTSGAGGYDPVYHGPFLYFVTSLSFFLFGTNDFTARLMPAIFGVVLVGLIWLLRPFIGRVGALLGALMVVLSPSISYYSRSLRHDIFALTGTLLLFVSILWFMRTHQAKWVYLGAVGLAVAYTSHELTFIIMLIFALFLAIAAFAFPSFAGRISYGGRTGYVEPVNPVRSAISALGAQRWTLLGAFLLFLAIYIVLFTNFLTKPWLVTSGITEGLKYWTSQHGYARGDQPIFYYFLLMLIYEPLAFFAGLGTIIYMLVTWGRGGTDSLATGNDVDVEPEPATAAATDPYGVPLPAIDGMRGLTLAFLAFWALGAFIAFSLAGERMPWLNMQPALPFTLLAAAGLGRLITRLDWRQAMKGGGVLLGVTVVLFIFAAFSLMAHLGERLSNRLLVPGNVSKADFDMQMGARAIGLFLFAFGLLALAGWLAYKMMPGRALKIVGITFGLIFLGYGLRSMMLLNYRHGDVPTEMLVYTQSSPDVPIVAEMIKRLSRDETAFDTNRNADDVTGGRSLSIAIDETEAITWPFNWYFRDMRNYRYFNADRWKANEANLVAADQPVILASQATEDTEQFQTFIANKYTTNKYVLNWWFPEQNTYKRRATTVNEQGQTVDKLRPQLEPNGEHSKDANGQDIMVPYDEGDLGLAWRWLTGNGLKYFLYRDPGRDPSGNELKLGSRVFYLHVRNDLGVKVGLAAPPGGTSATGTPDSPDPKSPIHKMTDLGASGFDRGQFNLPRGIATAPDGSFYVVDTANMRIQKFNAQGVFQKIIAGVAGEAEGQFKPRDPQAPGDGPGGIAVDKQGNLYVADTWNHRVQKFDATGKFVKSWGGFIALSDQATNADDPANNSKFYGPRGVAVGPDGNVYVTDTGNKRVSIFDANGTFLRQISSGLNATKIAQSYPFNAPGEMNEPMGIAVDASGNVYVADRDNRRIQKFDNTGKPAAQWPIPSGGYDAADQYTEPFLALDAAGNIYTTLPGSQKVAKLSPTGQILGEKSAEGAATLKKPTGIAVTADGTIYVVDTVGNGVVNFGKIQP
ncbi:MAG TPA: flippase activity-associated protein Agl23 [Chloroflexia bacterium]|nr:flippase activity-associated protein Agl23 [Chloroflexia bacterium]